jgi:hypothetical protein
VAGRSRPGLPPARPRRRRNAGVWRRPEPGQIGPADSRRARPCRRPGREVDGPDGTRTTDAPAGLPDRREQMKRSLLLLAQIQHDLRRVRRVNTDPLQQFPLFSRDSQIPYTAPREASCAITKSRLQLAFFPITGFAGPSKVASTVLDNERQEDLREVSEYVGRTPIDASGVVVPSAGDHCVAVVVHRHCVAEPVIICTIVGG